MFISRHDNGKLLLGIIFFLSHFETNLFVGENPGRMVNLVDFTVVTEIGNRDNYLNRRKTGRVMERIFGHDWHFSWLFTGLDGCYRARADRTAAQSVFIYI